MIYRRPTFGQRLLHVVALALILVFVVHACVSLVHGVAHGLVW